MATPNRLGKPSNRPSIPKRRRRESCRSARSRP